MRTKTRRRETGTWSWRCVTNKFTFNRQLAPGHRGNNGKQRGTTGNNGWPVTSRGPRTTEHGDGEHVRGERQDDASCAALCRTAPPLCRRHTSDKAPSCGASCQLRLRLLARSKPPPDDCFLLPTTTTTTTHSHTLFTTHSDRLVMATSTYPQDHQGHSYPPLPPTSHDINRSETNISSVSSFAKKRYPPDDDDDNETDTETNPLPKEVATQWDQPPPPLEPQRQARKWWQTVRVHANYLSLFPR
jgi:hypothetical protein